MGKPLTSRELQAIATKEHIMETVERQPFFRQIHSEQKYTF